MPLNGGDSTIVPPAPAAAPAAIAPPEVPPGMRTPSTVRLLAWGIPAWGIAAVVLYMAITRQPDDLLNGLAFAGIAMTTSALAVTAWVAHSRRLAHRREATRGGRTGAANLPLVITKDALGRRIEVAPDALTARVISVRVDGDVKTIRGVES